MSIIHKVKSRKIAFLYYYQHHFIQRINYYDISETIAEEPILGQDLILELTQQQNHNPIVSIASQLWYQDNMYDRGFAQDLIQAYPLFEDQMVQIIKPYTATFDYTEMNAIEQAILHLGYTEYMQVHTPYKIIIDQMVEIAKRYSTPSSAKLINGVLHTLLSACESSVVSSSH